MRRHRVFCPLFITGIMVGILIISACSQPEEEKSNVTVQKLSSECEYYNEVIEIDPECADYIEELVFYDEEIADTFIIHVSLPPDRDPNDTYPLVVMTDGVWRLSDHPELHAMMKNGEIEKVVLASIGYPNGYDYRQIRERDFLKEPDKYLQFIVDDLVPYLIQNYPITEENMTLTGHSYGGLWAYYALLNSDTIGKNTFHNYYIGSPSLQAKTQNLSLYDYEETYYQRNRKLATNVYVSVGGKEETYFIRIIEEFGNQLESRNYDQLNFLYEVIEGETHDTVFKPSIKKTMQVFYKEDESD